MKKYILILLMMVNTVLHAQKNATVSFEKWISLKTVSSPIVSPDGKTIVYNQNSTDWANNTYDTELWMIREGSEPIQLTRTSKGSSSMADFTPDGKYVSFVANRGDKAQLYLISILGGEAIQVTRDDDGISSYEWSPDGTKIIYGKPAAESKIEKGTKDRYGAYAVEGEEFRQNHLWILPFHYDSVFMAGQLPCYPAKKDSSKSAVITPCFVLPVAKPLIEGDFSVGGYSISPDGKTLAFNRQPNPLILSSRTSDIVLMNLETKTMTTVVKNAGGDFFNAWSPDGKFFVYGSQVNDSTTDYFKNNRLFIYDIAAKTSHEIAKDIDENKSVIDWNASGLFVAAQQKTKRNFYRVDPVTGHSNVVPLSLDLPAGASFSKKSEAIVVVGRNHAGINEIYRWKLNQPLQQLTNATAQIAAWNTPVSEVISWKSKDGAIIEGILLKPKNFDPKKKYPLLCVIHGGPTGIDLPDPAPSGVYPMAQWIEKGALVLRVNYRGSAGYGEKFRSLNVGNLGVGDMWDVMSGVDYLNSKGMIDTSRMGCMGWSQGGYISAFLTTNTNRFKAISVGAGISNWVTYYVSTDITPFTRQYLEATPWQDMNVYLKTSPMTNINKASTPTLIQHGEFDKRVPIPNAYELYRGLQDRGIPSKLIVYKGFGHGITKPKERLAALWHNWLWFNEYVFGEKGETMPTE
ncbi:MAG TPA: S9 family peptidase [Phnomibacter sp.]|nr:S9 family peptidase [Phnomibacter sp.]